MDQCATPPIRFAPPVVSRLGILWNDIVPLAEAKDATILEVGCFEGRVLDSQGKAVPGAHVQFQKAVRLPSGQAYGNAMVPFGDVPLQTDPQGLYRTPTAVARHENRPAKNTAEETQISTFAIVKV